MNRKTIYTILIISICVLPVFKGFSQNKDELNPYKNTVKVIGRAYKDSVKLRWAPASPVSWHYANKYGYIIEKYLILKDGKLVDEPVKSVLVKEPLKPQPLNKWEPFAETDDYVAIAAQAIFGESFDVSTNAGNDILQMINKSRELESRYSFALFSADVSPKTAELSGLLYVDKNVKPNEKYLYKVIAAVPKDVMEIDTGYVYIGSEDYEPLPKPMEFKAAFGDKSVMLTWEHKFNERFYIAYQVERSENDKNFTPLSNRPQINTQKNAGVLQDYMFRLDSIPQNNKEYFYRIRGITSFGEYGPYSDTISGYGYELFAANPAIVSKKVMLNKYIQINWEFPDSLNHLIQGFQVHKGHDDNGPFTNLTDTLLSATERTFTDESEQTTNYYKIIALDKKGEPHPSYPYIVLLIDSIPPAKPQVPKGSIDSAGVVTIYWKHNTEPDLLGYRVFRANHKTDEFSQVTKDPIDINGFIDTINVKTLTQKVYYKILALDQHFNPSEFSEIIELKRPDKIPPVQAVFTEFESNETGIQLNWINSSSVDVSKHILYRKAAKEENWIVKGIFNAIDSITTFKDTSAKAGTIYQYTLLAVDESGLESEPAIPVSIKAYEIKIRPQIKDIKYKTDRDKKTIYLTWEYNYEGVERYLIYRGINDNTVNLYNGVGFNHFRDNKIKSNNTYRYLIKAIYKDGTQSAFSEQIEIKF